MTDLLTLEKALWAKGYTAVGGIDEAGRGPFAGPVAAACVILDPLHIPEGINDSKKLSPKKREALFDQIMATAIVSVSMTFQEEIDRINILQATKVTMRAAVAGLPKVPDFLLIDGNFTIGTVPLEKAVIGGDALSASIGAASIIAKVTRDRYMCEMDKLYPQYGFAKHKGYGTQAHRDAILQYGPCPLHRRTFIKKILESKK